MNSENQAEPSLREMELEVETEGREWMRQRLEKKLQAQADRLGGVFPPKRAPGVASAGADDASAQRVRPSRSAGAVRPGSGRPALGRSDAGALGTLCPPTVESGAGR